MKKVLILVLVSFITACGFEPLYVEKKTAKKWYFGNEFDISINGEMEKIKIESISGRFGQKLRNDLIDIIVPAGVNGNYAYKLYVLSDEVQIDRQALRKDITASRERARYKVVYYMTDRSGEELVRGDSVAYVSYDIMANPYSTTMAQKKAETDAAHIISNDISLRLGAYFHSKLVMDKEE
ncbi:MAG: LPS assembly lipoprotein LptE [Alphaproteobacteria bacterium]|nr:LPS assembly lipoprotein LptE [Alphaproteobacteria bacterium]